MMSSSAGDHGKSNDGYLVRSYRDADQAGVLRLLELGFEAWPGKRLAVDPVEHLEWKMASFPGLTEHHVVVECDDEIVGFRLAIVQPVLAGGRELLLHQGADSVVHPDHRGRNLMVRIKAYEAEVSGVAFDLRLIGQSANPAMTHMRDRIGYPRFANRIEVLSCARSDRPRDASAKMTREVALIDDRVDALWRSAGREFTFGVVRTAKYLNWRYCDSRAGGFVVRVAEQGDTMLGCEILCTRGNKGYIADLFVLPGREDVLRALLDEAFDHFAGTAVHTVECWIAETHPYRDALAASGFLRKRRLRAFGYMPLRTPVAELAFLGNEDATIHLMAGDVDWI